MDTPLLQCRACKNPLRGEDVNEALGIARCSHCHAVLDLRRGSAPAEEGVRKRPVVALPERFEVGNDRGMGLRISWRWFKWSLIPAVFFCVVWDGFLVFWYATAFASADTPLMMILFPLGHLAVGIGITYSTLAGFLNTTELTVNSTNLRIKHGPLPWWGNRLIPSAELKQVFCREVTHRNKNGVSYSYTVHIQRTNGTEQKILSGLAQVDQAVFIEQQLEQHLRITDVAVVGEVAR